MNSIFSAAQNIPDVLEAKDALPLLVKATELGQSRGCFDITEAKVLHDAIKTINKEDAEDKEMRVAKFNLVVAAEKTQKAGNTFSLGDAALLFKAIEAVQKDVKQDTAVQE